MELIYSNISLKYVQFIIVIIIFISSWYKIVKNTTKNQPSSIDNYTSDATLRTKKM